MTLNTLFQTAIATKDFTKFFKVLGKQRLEPSEADSLCTKIESSLGQDPGLLLLATETLANSSISKNSLSVTKKIFSLATVHKIDREITTALQAAILKVNTQAKERFLFGPRRPASIDVLPKELPKASKTKKREVSESEESEAEESISPLSPPPASARPWITKAEKRQKRMDERRSSKQELPTVLRSGLIKLPGASINGPLRHALKPLLPPSKQEDPRSQTTQVSKARYHEKKTLTLGDMNENTALGEKDKEKLEISAKEAIKLALMYFKTGQYELANKAYCKAFLLYRKLGNRIKVCCILNELGASFRKQKKYKEAVKYIKIAAKEFLKCTPPRYDCFAGAVFEENLCYANQGLLAGSEMMLKSVEHHVLKFSEIDQVKFYFNVALAQKIQHRFAFAALSFLKSFSLNQSYFYHSPRKEKGYSVADLELIANINLNLAISLSSVIKQENFNLIASQALLADTYRAQQIKEPAPTTAATIVTSSLTPLASSSSSSSTPPAGQIEDPVAKFFSSPNKLYDVTENNYLGAINLNLQLYHRHKKDENYLNLVAEALFQLVQLYHGLRLPVRSGALLHMVKIIPKYKPLLERCSDAISLWENELRTLQHELTKTPPLKDQQ